LLAGLARYDGPNIPSLPDEGTPVHLSSADAGRLEGAWLLIPEVPHVAGDNAPNLAVALDYARFYGLRSAALFYDLIPLRQPGYESMAPAHDRYVRSLVAVDLLLAISAHSASDLRSWWTEHDYEDARLPPVVGLPLPDEVVGIPRATRPDDPPHPPIRFVALGTVEPRKNQVEAMRAFARLCVRRRDLDLRLDVIGHVHPAVADEVREVTDREKRIRLHGFLPDADVRKFVDAAHATVFTSLYEGFGLPIAESLWQGKPCLCSDSGSMGEIAAGGGCLAVPGADGKAIEAGLERLANDPSLRTRLSHEACERKLRSWRDYAEELVAKLIQAPEVQRLVVIDGSRGTDATAARLVAAGASVSRMHWRTDSRALLPGGVGVAERTAPGDGQLRGVWTVLSAAGTASPREVSDILDAAQGFGLKVAVEAEPETSTSVLARADLALFRTTLERDAALASALRTLPRTVTLRDRFRVGTGADALKAIVKSLPRIAAAGPPDRPSRVFYWVGLTVTQPFNTGVQRVTRLLAAALLEAGVEVVPVKWDKKTSAVAPITAEEAEHFARWSGPYVTSRPLPDSLAGEWMLLPEITVPMVPSGSHVAKLAHAAGMHVAAIFYDLIPAKMAENYGRRGIEAFNAYWRGLAEADVVLPISWTAAADLQGWLVSEGLRLPAIVPCPLAGDMGGEPRVTRPAPAEDPNDGLKLLAVGTWEPRKNYPRLLRALMNAQKVAGRPIELTIVGRRAGFDELDAEVRRLAVEGTVVLHDHVGDEELRELFAAADATIFASWEEGFGLPVLESLWHGRPCLCHDGSAMAELGPGGGVALVDMLDETAITDALVGLANDDERLAQLGEEAVKRPIRRWNEYAEDVLRAMSRAVSPPGWPLPAVVRRRPLLTCAITTYNRAEWLAHSLPRLLDATRPWRDVVEVVVCDNASTDETPAVVKPFRGEQNFVSVRNPTNVGMLGSLGTSARASQGAFVWLLGDDDLLVEGAIENVLEGLAAHPHVEMAYMNYAYTTFDDPARLQDGDEIIANATPIADGGPNRYVRELREVAGLNENLFTAIYACCFRRDHALRAYQLDTSGPPFTSLATCVPSAVYALSALQDRPAWWVGEPAVVINMNVSWLRWVLLWRLERMPDLYDEAERRGIDPERLDRYRMQHLMQAEQRVRSVYFDAEDVVRTNFSLARLLERSKHLPEFRKRHLSGVRRVYAEAWAAGRVAVDPIPPDEMFARYGLE
jgi:glycosyltransferase involved in cell wall biosynthesis